MELKCPLDFPMIKVALNAAYWRLRGHIKPGTSRVGDLPPDVLSYLTRNNPALVDLKKRYASVTNVPHSFWASWEDKVNLLKFRGENDYVSQAYHRKTERRYEMSCAYVETTDQLGLFDGFTEDQLFGVKTWEFIPGKLVSRDLLDSVLEITFAKEAMGLDLKDNIRLLDIGAGYGRFAHRFTTAFKNSSVTCIDAVATSTFISDFYLKFRKCDRAKVVAFDRLSDLPAGSFDVAANIHSWSECTKEFIAWWLDRICDLKIQYLFHVPHTETLATIEADGSSKTYDDELERRGFKLVLKRRKFYRSKCVDRVGLFPTDYRLYKRDL